MRLRNSGKICFGARKPRDSEDCDAESGFLQQVEQMKKNCMDGIFPDARYVTSVATIFSDFNEP